MKVLLLPLALLLAASSSAWAQAPTKPIPLEANSPLKSQGTPPATPAPVPAAAPAPGGASAPDGGQTPQPTPKTTTAVATPAEPFGQFGFSPALYLIRYKERVLKDPADARLRGDGTLALAGATRSSVSVGVEVHYGMSFGTTSHKVIDQVNGKEEFKYTSGQSVSPYIGLFDLQNGVNGIAYGVLYTYWRGDSQYNKTSALNMGIGWTIHKDRVVLAEGMAEGKAPPAGTLAEDYTTRKDVKGMTLMISASIGF